MWAHSAEYRRNIKTYSIIPYLIGLPFNNLVNKWKSSVILISHFQRVVDRFQQKQYFPDVQIENEASLLPKAIFTLQKFWQFTVRRWQLFGGRTGWTGFRNCSSLAEKVGKGGIFTCRILSWPRFYLGGNGKSLVDTNAKKCWKFSRRKTSFPIQILIQSAYDILPAASFNFCFYMLQRDTFL